MFSGLKMEICAANTNKGQCTTGPTVTTVQLSKQFKF